MTLTKKAAIPAADVGATGKVYIEADVTPEHMHKTARPQPGKKDAKGSLDNLSTSSQRKDNLKIAPKSTENINVKIIEMGKGKHRKVSFD